MDKKRLRTAQAGFTLVEVIVSLGILAVLLIAFSSLLLQGRTTMADTADYDRLLGDLRAVMEGSTIPAEILTEAGAAEELVFDFTDGAKSIFVTVDEKGVLLNQDSITGHLETFHDAGGKIQLRRWVPDQKAPEESEDEDDAAKTSE